MKSSDLQLVPGTKTGECMCNPIGKNYYNSKSGTCNCIDEACTKLVDPICGNSIHEAG